MDRSVVAWFDKAFEHMYTGDFVSAAACFQHVIDKSKNAYARNIAQRNLDWYCIPLDSIVETLRGTPRPMTLEELLSEVSSSETLSDYVQQVSGYLRRVVTVCYLGNQLWIHRSHFEAAIELVVADFQTSNLPITLTELAHELFMQLDGQMLTVSEHILKALRAELAKMDNISVLDNDCVFTGANLEHFGTELVQSIRQNKKPASLTTILDTMPWPQPVKAALRTKALRQWLYLQGRRNLIEVADDWWFIENLVDLPLASLSHVFRDRFVALDTGTILLRHLFDPSQQPKRLSKSFIYSQSRHLARNQSLIKIGDGLWFLVETASDLVRQMIDELAQADRPRSYHELLTAVIPPRLDKSFISDSLSDFLVPRLRQDSQVIEISEGMWLHMAAIEAILDRAYELLQDSGARPSSELLSQCLGVPLSAHQCQPSFVSEFELALQQDNRFMLDSRQDLWTAIPPGDPKNNLAYVILYQEHRPLSRQEIVEQAKNMPHIQTLAFQLDSDTRFKQLADGRWILARWIIINDLAASYLAQSPIPLLAETIARKVCELYEINIADAIFVPEGDPRFVRASLGKWTCPSLGKLLSPEMLERLVQSASGATDGITLEALVKKSLHDSPSTYYNLEQILLDDGRLIHCNDLWYPRDKCFYSVTSDDLEKIKAHITQVGCPIPADILAQVCLNRFVCLTDLVEGLADASEFAELGSAGWIVRGLQPETAGRGREFNYPIHSGKYVPTIAPEEFETIDEKDDDSGSDNAPETSCDRSTLKSRVRRITIALSFEDIRDGTLMVRSRFKRLLSHGLELSALRFADEQKTGFSCWYDADNELLRGFGNWFKSRGLTFGDKIRFSITGREDQFSVQVVGERSEQVYLEGVRRSQVQSLIDEAKRANRSYHDLTMEVLEYFGTTLQIDDLWAMVNYRRVAKKRTLSAILSSRPYFVSERRGYWRFDKEEYAQMIRDIERKVRKLEKTNQQLRDENEALSRQVSEARILRSEVKKLQTGSEAREKSEGEIARLKNELKAAESRADHAEALASQTAEKYDQLQVSLSEAEQRIDALNAELEDLAELTTTREEDNRQLAADAAALTKQLETMSETERHSQERVAELEEASLLVRSEAAQVRQRNQMIEKNLALVHAKQQEVIRQHAQETQESRHQLVRIKKVNHQLQLALEVSQEALSQLENETARLRSELAAAENTAEEAEALANQWTEKREQVQASLTSAKQRIEALDFELRKQVEVIAAREEENRHLMTQVASLKAQLDAMSETEPQLRKRVADLQDALQQAKRVIAEAEQRYQILEENLSRVEAEKQQTAQQLTRLTTGYEELNTEFAKAMALLNSWSGKLAMWWATRQAKDLPAWPKHTGF